MNTDEDYIKKVWSWFKLKADEFTEVKAKNIQRNAIMLANTWRDSLIIALSDPLPSNQYGKLRTPRTRLFPYYNKKTKNSTHIREELGKDLYKVKLHKVKNGYTVSTTITNITNVDSTNRNDFRYHIKMTDLGIKKPKNAPAGAWKNWASDIFVDGKERGGVEPVSELFNKLKKLRGNS